MKSIEKISSEEKNIEDFSIKYFERLNFIFKNIDLKQLSKLEKEFLELRKKNSTLFVFGNGGGAATAMTMANDLGFDILKKTNKKTFKIFSLNDNSSVVTAIANDTNYNEIFINQLIIIFLSIYQEPMLIILQRTITL